jgi:hypothetical protein
MQELAAVFKPQGIGSLAFLNTERDPTITRVGALLPCGNLDAGILEQRVVDARGEDDSSYGTRLAGHERPAGGDGLSG